MALKFANSAISTLAGNILVGDVTLSVQAADAAKFPALNPGDWFPATIKDAGGNKETVKVTARAGAVLTIVRAQEGTTAKAFNTGARIELRLTSAVLRALQNMSDLPDVNATRTNLGIDKVDNTPDSLKPISVAQAAKNTEQDNAIAGVATAAANALAALLPPGSRIGFYGITAPAGWVRCNGRTLGSAASGATERANADCQPLFLHLWAVDGTLAVSGGRGATAAADWAANKTIALPDYRDRVAVGLGGMGNADINLIPDAMVDGGENNTTLGATVGASSHVLTVAQIPAHQHPKGTLKMPNHGHPTNISVRNDSQVSSTTNGAPPLTNLGNNSYPAYTGAPGGAPGQHVGGSGELDIVGSTGDTGGGGSHPNVQPSTYELILLKL